MTLSRRDLLTRLGYSAAALSTVAASPVNRLLDTRSAVAADAPALTFARVGAARSDAQARVLATLDDTHRRLPDGGMEVLLRPGDLARLRRVDLDVAVLDADVLADLRQRPGRRPLAQMPGESPSGEYRVWEDFERELRALVAAHPERAMLLELPGSSLLGYRPYGIVICTDPGRRDGRPVVHHDGMHHSREWPAAEMPLMFAYDLLENYGTDPRVTRIVDRVRTIIIPNLNPDGFIRSRESVVAADSSTDPTGAVPLALAVGGLESYWRKNLRGHSDTNHELRVEGVARYGNVDAYGIDLNRNYGFLWGDDEGSSGVRNDQTYRGAAPYSEPETANVRASFLSSAPVTAITHHTSGEIMLHPWGRDPDSNRSRDWRMMNDIGLQMGESNGYEPKQSFGLYPTSGTSRDWGHAATSTLIWTFEHGREFHGPYADTVPAMYEKNRGAFLTHAETALDPTTHLVVRGRVTAPGRPRPLPLVVTKDQTGDRGTPVTGGTFVDDPVRLTFLTEPDGSFELHLPPSTRPFLEAAPADPDDVQLPTGNPYPGGFDAVLESHGLQAGTEPYVLRLPDGRTVEVTGGRGDVVRLGTLRSGRPVAEVSVGRNVVVPAP